MAPDLFPFFYAPFLQGTHHWLNYNLSEQGQGQDRATLLPPQLSPKCCGCMGPVKQQYQTPENSIRSSEKLTFSQKRYEKVRVQPDWEVKMLRPAVCKSSLQGPQVPPRIFTERTIPWSLSPKHQRDLRVLAQGMLLLPCRLEALNSIPSIVPIHQVRFWGKGSLWSAGLLVCHLGPLQWSKCECYSKCVCKYQQVWLIPVISAKMNGGGR